MRKFDRARYGPSWFEVIFGALLSVILGLVLAVSYFVFRPVTRVKELPKDPIPGMVYYIEGSRDYANARRLTAKQRFFAKGGSVVVNEDELNTAANPVTAPVAPGSEPAAPPTGIISTGSPNFRIHDGLLQITVPMRIRADTVMIDQVVLVQATGTFARRGDVFVFAPKTVFVGSCPVDRIPKAVDYVMKKVFDSQPVPPEIAASWGKLADVTIEGSTLRLTMP